MILAGVYLGIWAVSLISFWLFGSGSDALGYSIMYLWILLPVTTFILSLDHRKERLLGTEKMAYCPRIWTDVYACGIWDIQCGQYDYVSKNQSAGIYYDTNRYNGFSDRNGNRHGNPPCAQSNKEEMKESEKSGFTEDATASWHIEKHRLVACNCKKNLNQANKK